MESADRRVAAVLDVAGVALRRGTRDVLRHVTFAVSRREIVAVRYPPLVSFSRWCRATFGWRSKCTATSDAVTPTGLSRTRR